MNWKKSIFVVTLLGMTVLAMVGCSKAEEIVPATEQPTPVMEQTVPAPDGTIPLPPEGVTPGERPPAPAMDLAAAAAKLGITEQQLREVLGDTLQGPPDLTTVAAKLGVSEDALREALGLPESGPPPGSPPPGSPPPAGPGPTGPVQ